MPIDARDPHYFLGIEHGRVGAEPYPFQDAENMRRYLIGYEVGGLQRQCDGLLYAQQTAPVDLQQQLQQPRRITATDLQRWMNQQQKP